MVHNIGYASPLREKFNACMVAIEKALELHFTDIWLETDSTIVVKAFHSFEGIPWRLQARWANCLRFCKGIHSRCSHVHRSGNLVADALAKNGQGLATHSLQWWDALPSFVLPFLFRDNIDLSVNSPSMN